MLENIFKRKNKQSKCVVLYCFDFDRNLTKHLFEFLIFYFKVKLNIEFNYCGFYNETYKDNYGKLELIKPKILKENWSEIVNITLDNESAKSKDRKVSVEFNISRPIRITISISEEYAYLDVVNFSKEIFPIFSVLYGFSYYTQAEEWITSYAAGDWQHSSNVIEVKRLSKEIAFNWNKNCEKIQNGFIRDVYNENLLANYHVNFKIGEKLLGDIICDYKFGELTAINNEFYFWKLTQDEVEAARKYLYNTNIII